MIVSPLLLDKLCLVLGPSEVPPLPDTEDAPRFEDVIEKLAEVEHDLLRGAHPMTDDPDDDFLVVLAEPVGADALASGDPHLTSPQRQGLTEMTPRGFLDSLNS